MYAGQEFHSKFFNDFDPGVGVISAVGYGRQLLR